LFKAMMQFLCLPKSATENCPVFFTFVVINSETMGLPVNDKNKGKKGKKAQGNAQGSKFISKGNTKGAANVRPHKAGGTRGS
jgi:hypothetical protein